MSELYKDLSIDEFAKRLGSAAPTPGGGAAAALASALGASLVMMVANLTIGKTGYEEFEELSKDMLEEAEILKGRLLAGMDKDSEAFGKLMAAYGMPKGDERNNALFTASVEATREPLAVMEDSLAALRLALTMKGRSNRSVESDLDTAVNFLRAGIMSENCNVKANLPVIKKTDAELASELGGRAAYIITKTGELTSGRF
jgi:formiminotetrahydrofolate cyclodeaminase